MQLPVRMLLLLLLRCCPSRGCCCSPAGVGDAENGDVEGAGGRGDVVTTMSKRDADVMKTQYDHHLSCISLIIVAIAIVVVNIFIITMVAIIIIITTATTINIIMFIINIIIITTPTSQSEPTVPPAKLGDHGRRCKRVTVRAFVVQTLANNLRFRQ